VTVPEDRSLTVAALIALDVRHRSPQAARVKRALPATAPLLVSLIAAGTALAAAGPGAEANSAAIRVYSHLLEPREHPDYERRAVKPPSWDTFKNRTQFTTLRGFNVDNDRITGYAEELEKYTRRFELGDVIWPSYPILFATNLADFADEIKRRDLYLFDVWGYVPGSGPGGYWQQFRPPPEALATLEAKLGERWLGTDVGEQDGRYIGGYADQLTPSSGNRSEQYLNFQRHFERVGDDLGHKHATLVSLNFGHYFLKEGTYTLIGAETAQALPNSQVYYAFIRGAGKQYGVPWFGNASIFNRWGFKTYGSSGKSDGYEHGPTKGTSLSLMKRLLYSHILYNSVAVGFENGWLDGDQLSPLGRIQQAAQRWVKEHGQPGVMHTPVAVLLDFNAGWTFPRHLYTDKVYRVWGNLPYAEGDYLTDAALDLLYPGYQDASYFHDESGFLAATPYGDIADCLFSDAPLWVLERYPLVMLAGQFARNLELLAKLDRYVEGGGHLVSFAAAEGAAAGAESTAPTILERALVTVGADRFVESSISLMPPMLHPDATVLAECQTRAEPVPIKQPAAVQWPQGKGRRTVFYSAYGLAHEHPPSTVKSEVDKPLARLYPMLPHVRKVLGDLLRAEVLFEVANTNLAVITCRKAPGEYTLGVFNNTWHELPFKIASRCGPIAALHELPLDPSEKGAVGYTPEGLDAAKLGASAEGTIAGGDVRIFALKVTETNVVELAHRPPPPRPSGRFLPLRRIASLKEEVLARPTFFEHWDGVVLDWRYLREREKGALETESRWLHRQGLRLAVDLSSGVDLFPTLRLINNVSADYEASMAVIADVLAKMEVLGARDLIFSLHRHPENNFTDDQTRAAFEQTLKQLAADAANRRITLHLRLAPGKPPWSLEDGVKWLERVNAPNLKLAPSTALLIAAGAKPDADPARFRGRVGLWLVSAPGRDVAGRLCDAHRPLHEVRPEDTETLRRWLAVAPGVPWVLDSLCADADAEYLEVAALERLSKGSE